MARTIYTLTQPVEGHPEMSGRIMYIRISKKTNALTFYDATTGEYIAKSSAVVTEQRRDSTNAHVRIVIDDKGTMWSFTKLADLLPTKLPAEEPLTVLAAERIFKHINYGDGYSGVKYTFNKKIDKNTFTTFIEDELGHKLRPEMAWYLDYDTVEPGMYEGSSYCDRNYNDGIVDNVWIYKNIRPYTD